MSREARVESDYSFAGQFKRYRTYEFVSGDGITSDEFVSVGGPGVEGTLMTFAPDPRKRPEAKAIVDRAVLFSVIS